MVFVENEKIKNIWFCTRPGYLVECQIILKALKINDLSAFLFS